ncbi:MAG: hypothetical protein AAFY41_05300, partial [Bacteroidota bacterium]
PNKDIDDLTQQENTKVLDFQEDLLKATAATNKFTGHRQNADLLKEAVNLGNIYAEINPADNGLPGSEKSIDFFLDTLWQTKGDNSLSKSIDELNIFFEKSTDLAGLFRAGIESVEAIQALPSLSPDLTNEQEINNLLSNVVFVRHVFDSSELFVGQVPDNFPQVPRSLAPLEAAVRHQVNAAIRDNLLTLENPDLQDIVDTYFESTSINSTPREIDSSGIVDNFVTTSALIVVTNQLAKAAAARSSAVKEVIDAGISSATIETTVGELVSELGLPSHLIFVDEDSNDALIEEGKPLSYADIWKYSGVDNVPGFLIGGVGQGGAPPVGAPFFSDTRIISADSKITLIIEFGMFLSLEADYSVRIGDTFDFAPGGGGFEEGYSEEFKVAVGVEALRILERAGMTFDVPFFTEFSVSNSTVSPVVIG